MNIKCFQGGFDKNFSYLIWCEKTNTAAIIDPAVNPIPILELIEKKSLILSKIFITHTHHDHFQYLSDYLFYYPNIEICCHKSSIKYFCDSNITGLEDNEIILIGETFVTALFTPGHYHDSICYWIKQNNTLFTGDTMFVGRTGRTISTTSNIVQLYESIYSIILSLSDNTKIYPGHNYGYKKNITLKNNKIISKFFSCNSLNEFIKEMENFELNYKKK